MNIRSRVLACAFAVLPRAASAADPAGAASTFVSLLLPLLLITAAAGAATFLLTRWKGSVVKREGPLQLVQVLALGPRERLALVKAGARYLVIGVTSGGISRVAEFSQLHDAAAESPASSGTPAAEPAPLRTPIP